ncbi:probable receptor-like protein kinase At5g38990 [Actinidia eriantha]|uniref:probable receptor-like protein kinase At5g38990 n=1 Tax=Actinidia eriantha TaxID=165200 RepID=UPI0025827F7E|nr:probable receptor-like protein kinase At5g38990 [Actinidia eriantha]
MSDVVQRLEFALASQDEGAYSSTDIEGEDQEVDVNVSMVVNMPIDSLLVGEEEEKEHEEEVVDIRGTNDEQIIDKFPKSDGVEQVTEQPTGSPACICARKSQPSPLIPCRRFSIAEVQDATNNFHRNFVIKYGGPGGEMYRGYIDNRELQVAIERRTQQSENMFLKEVEMRSQLRHLHMVSFIGYCNDSDETILVYEYLVKGNLINHLYGTGKDPLPWKKRLEICIGAAQALQYLHTNFNPPMIHGDLKSTSSLLNEKWVPKVSGLKVSDLDLNNITRTIVTAVVMETLGYMDPEYLLIAELCLLYRGVERPLMDSVVQTLQRALQLQERAGDKFKLGAPGDPPEEIRAAAIRAYRKIDLSADNTLLME